jgi:hypothetical protein
MTLKYNFVFRMLFFLIFPYLTYIVGTPAMNIMRVNLNNFAQGDSESRIHSVLVSFLRMSLLDRLLSLRANVLFCSNFRKVHE